MTVIKQKLGKIAYKSKGEYASTTEYEINDVVTYEGSSYVALGTTIGNVPTNTTYWQLLASKGDTGAKGDTGETGQTGPANTLTIGTVEGGATASATITGDSPNQTLNLVLPKGDTGASGQDGQDGEDGFSPVATVSKSGSTTTISVTDKNGTTTAQVNDGEIYTLPTASTSTLGGVKIDGDTITIDNNGVISSTGGSGTPDDITTRLNANEELETIGIYTIQNNARKIWEGTLAQYNALQTKDSDTYYNITDDEVANGLPQGGTAGQVLKKASSTDYDTSWVSEHNYTHETWTFTLEDDSTVDKEVVLW